MDQLGKVRKARRVIREVVYLRHLTSEGITRTLEMYPRIESRSRLMETAIEWYLNCVMRFGLDANWHPPVPGITSQAGDSSPLSVRRTESNEKSRVGR